MSSNVSLPRNLHRYHLLDVSPWPLFTAFAGFFFMVAIVLCVSDIRFSSSLLWISTFNLLGVIACWWRDIVRESTFEGNHTTLVQTSLKYGMVLFIISEVMFFFSIFWAYFHSSLAPVPEIGSIWPPLGVESIYAWGIPLLNTILLLSSGATVTWAHHALLTGNKNQTLTAMYYSIGLATVFTLIQFFEYIESTFSMSDGVYGSTFFMATGFHGFHVIIGTVFLAITTIRIFGNQMTKEHHFGFEAAIWYWHFVDVVWLFLFVTIYWWGG